MTILAFVLGLLLGIALGFIFFRSELAYLEGWQHGERYGRTEGYKQAWLKRNKALLDAQTQDWSSDDD